MAAPGLIIAAAASGSGKTVVTLALLRLLGRSGVHVAAAKVGPDYIDPAFHVAAGGCACRNLDSWAMRPDNLNSQLATLGQQADLVLCEGVMGLFDGAATPAKPHTASTAEIAVLTGWPVVLVVDASRQGASVGAVLQGFVHYDPAVRVTGVIFNRVGSARHEGLLRAAAARAVPDVHVLGCLQRDPTLALPERHLGLVTAGEHPDLSAFLDNAARIVEERLDIPGLQRLAEAGHTRSFATKVSPPVSPLGQRIAVAQDEAFAFRYDGLLDGWGGAGAELIPFSPLADAVPPPHADAIYLPGGYPELHAGRLAASAAFLGGLRSAAAGGTVVWGECGGYMVLGDYLIDGNGVRHTMAGLLPVETSFASPRLSLGYRQLKLLSDGPLGPAGTQYRGHEFHYACLTRDGGGAAAFRVANAAGDDLGRAGHAAGQVIGSFLHLIDRDDSASHG